MFSLDHHEFDVLFLCVSGFLTLDSRCFFFNAAQSLLVFDTRMFLGYFSNYMSQTAHQN